MKIYVNVFHSMIAEIDSWNQFSDNEKFEIVKKYINLKNNDYRLVKYFDKYVNYLSKNSLKFNFSGELFSTEITFILYFFKSIESNNSISPPSISIDK